MPSLTIMLLAALFGVARATTTDTQVFQAATTFPTNVPGTGIFTLPVEPPLVSDDTSRIHISIITDSSFVPPDSTAVSTSGSGSVTPSESSSVAVSTPAPLPTSPSGSTSDTVTTSTVTSSSDDAPSETPETSTPNRAAAVTGVLHSAAGIALVVGMGLGVAI